MHIDQSSTIYVNHITSKKSSFLTDSSHILLHMHTAQLNISNLFYQVMQVFFFYFFFLRNMIFT